MVKWAPMEFYYDNDHNKHFCTFFLWQPFNGSAGSRDNNGITDKLLPYRILIGIIVEYSNEKILLWQLCRTM